MKGSKKQEVLKLQEVFGKAKRFTNWLPINPRWSAKVNLLKILVQRDLEARYKGSVLGNMWPLLTQLSQLLILTYVFSTVFKIKLSSTGLPSSNLSYGLWLFAGLNPWIAFSSGFNQAARSVINQPNLVKKLVFPLELLPLVSVFSAFVESSVGLIVLILLVGITAQTVHATLWLIPLIWLPQLLLTAGLGYLVAGLTVFWRDIPQTLVVLTNLWFYSTPIIYPVSVIPEQWRTWIFFLNPLATITTVYRDLVVVGKVEHGREWCVTLVAAIVIFYLGLKCYQKLRAAFADVL